MTPMFIFCQSIRKRWKQLDDTHHKLNVCVTQKCIYEILTLKVTLFGSGAFVEPSTPDLVPLHKRLQRALLSLCPVRPSKKTNFSKPRSGPLPDTESIERRFWTSSSRTMKKLVLLFVCHPLYRLHFRSSDGLDNNKIRKKSYDGNRILVVEARMIMF